MIFNNDYLFIFTYYVYLFKHYIKWKLQFKQKSKYKTFCYDKIKKYKLLFIQYFEKHFYFEYIIICLFQFSFSKFVNVFKIKYKKIALVYSYKKMILLKYIKYINKIILNYLSFIIKVF